MGSLNRFLRVSGGRARLLAFACAQLPTTITISDPRGEVAELLRRGDQLERQQRWGEALAYYEDAVRQHPEETTLQQRFDLVRCHYDLQRRYADRSFRDSITRLSADRALNLYDQVLLKIESHYVEFPQWKKLVQRGMEDLSAALGEPTFVEQNICQCKRPEAERFANCPAAFLRGLSKAVPTAPVRLRDRRVGTPAARYHSYGRDFGVSLRGDELPGPIFRLSDRQSA